MYVAENTFNMHMFTHTLCMYTHTMHVYTHTYIPQITYRNSASEEWLGKIYDIKSIPCDNSSSMLWPAPRVSILYDNLSNSDSTYVYTYHV